MPAWTRGADGALQNYFNYFTEVEERFQQRRGSLLLLSTLDWALIETWRDAGVPLGAVLRGIDEAFDKYEARKTKGRARRVNGLAWCAQAVMEATEQMREAATGVGGQESAAEGQTDGATLERDRVARHLERCREQLLRADSLLPAAARVLAEGTAGRLGELVAASVNPDAEAASPEALEGVLRALEQKLVAMLLATLPDEELQALRAQADREIAPYRSRMQALQIRQIREQFLEKRLLEKYALPRLSLFYMQAED